MLKSIIVRKVLIAAAFIGITSVSTPLMALTLKDHICNVNQVDLDTASSSSARLLVKCDAPATGVGGAAISYFAINMTTNLERAKMAFSMLTAAKIAGRPVRIFYNSDDTSTNGWGMSCNVGDCRPIVRVVLL